MIDSTVEAIRKNLKEKRSSAFAHSTLGKSMQTLLLRIDFLYNECHYLWCATNKAYCDTLTIPYSQCNCGFEQVYKCNIEKEEERNI